MVPIIDTDNEFDNDRTFLRFGYPSQWMDFATVFGIFVIPWLYYVVQSLSDKMGGKKAPEPVAATASSES